MPLKPERYQFELELDEASEVSDHLEDAKAFFEALKGYIVSYKIIRLF